jgi:dihydrofolate synthase/folylpolyglutamate synthase
VRLEERFAIDGAPVRTDVLAGLIVELRALIDDLIAKGSLDAPPTFFEVTTAIAFELFRRAGVQVAVLEVGLGGRLDSTNIVEPIAAAITTIDLITNSISATRWPRSRRKAGVIRRDIPVVVRARSGRRAVLASMANWPARSSSSEPQAPKSNHRGGWPHDRACHRPGS